jgi:hypothetical protein
VPTADVRIVSKEDKMAPLNSGAKGKAIGHEDGVDTKK